MKSLDKNKPKELDWTDIVKNIFFANGVKCDSEQFLIEDINNLIKEVQEETRKEVFDNLPKVIEPPEDIEKFKEKRQAFLAGQMNMLMRLNDLSLSITNKEKQK